MSNTNKTNRIAIADIEAPVKALNDTEAEKVIGGFDWQKVGRIACWGFAGLGAAATTAFVPGVGGFIGAAIFSGAAQHCSEQYKE